MKSVLGTDLKCCGTKPITGYFRDGFCRTDQSDQGRHVVACIVDERWIDVINNNLINIVSCIRCRC